MTIPKDLIDSLIPGYLSNRVEEMKILKQLLENSQLDEINKIGHKLAGNAGCYSIPHLGGIGKELEQAKTISEAREIIKRYQIALDELLLQYTI